MCLSAVAGKINCVMATWTRDVVLEGYTAGDEGRVHSLLFGRLFVHKLSKSSESVLNYFSQQNKSKFFHS